MKLNWVCFVYVIVCIHVMNSSEIIREEAISSCLNMLEYRTDGNEWFGLVQVQSPTATKTLKLELLLSLPGRLPSQYIGSVEPYRTKAEAVRKLNSNELVQFKVRFPLQNILPKLDQISVNGRVRCTEPPEAGSVVTQIQLHYTIFLEPTKHQQGHPIQQQQNITGLYYVDAPQRPATSPIEMCGTPKYDSAHSLGIETVASQKWPWLVAIYVRKPTGTLFQCGGTLVSERIVVTAASCFRTRNRTLTANEVQLFLGRHNIVQFMRPGAKISSAKELVIHGDFMRDGSKDADIAIAVLQGKVEFSEYIRPICLWEGVESLTKVLGTVAGWGSSNGSLTPEPSTIEIPIVSDVECLRSSEVYRPITTPNILCWKSKRNRTMPERCRQWNDA